MNTYMVDTAINIAINQASQKQVMSSREIATLCNKQHQHVKRDVETMCQQLELDASKFGHIYLDTQNRQQTEYLLDKDTCLCLVAGYNAKLRMAIIKRWQELEEANAIKDPMLLIAQMASLAYENNQRVLRNEKRLNQIEDKVNITIAKTNAILDDDNYFSVKGFCSYYNIKITSNQMSVLSKKCKKLSEIKEISYREITDPRWGKVKIYHKDILLEVFRLNQLI